MRNGASLVDEVRDVVLGEDAAEGVLIAAAPAFFFGFEVWDDQADVAVAEGVREASDQVADGLSDDVDFGVGIGALPDFAVGVGGRSWKPGARSQKRGTPGRVGG